MKANWINVKDKLPEFGERVLCYHVPKYPLMEGMTIDILRRQPVLPKQLPHFDENGFGMTARVTHWMPLPQKPSE